jgi:hypothetical protein
MSTAAPAITLDQYLDFMNSNNVDDPAIFEHLTATIDHNKVAALIAQIDAINAKTKPASMSAKAWEGQINSEKGALFEELGGLVLKSVKPFTSWSNVNTPINEIDWLVQIGPTGKHLTAIREWGTHFICECKFVNKSVNVTWLGKLRSVIQTHGANVAILMSSKGVSKKGRSSAVRYTIQMYAVMPHPVVIICLNMEEVKASLASRKFLQLISQRFVEAKAGVKPLQAIV